MSSDRTVVGIAAWSVAMALCSVVGAGTYRSPYAALPSSDGKAVYVTDQTADCVAVVDPAAGKRTAEWKVAGGPACMALSADGKTLFVTLQQANAVAAISTDGGKETKRIPVGFRPAGLALAPKMGRLFVCNMGDSTVSVIDCAELAEKFRVKAVREPMFAAVTPDEARVVVANSLATGPATESSTSASVSIFDVKEGKTGSTIKLPGGSTNCRSVVVSPDGKWAYLVHSVSRFQVPTTQLERGWMNTSALSVIDLTANELHATMLLDSIDLGAADPWGLALTADGNTLWVSLSGCHEVARIHVGRLVEMLTGKIPDQYARSLGSANINPWAEVKKDPKYRFQLVNDLMAMYFAELIQRFPVGGRTLLYLHAADRPFERGPRGIALAADGKQLYVPTYFGGALCVMDTETGNLLKNVPVGDQPEPDIVRKGEIAFHDAELCFQKWQSCATCHPNNARMDGLRWDLLNDGMGNHKRTRNLVYSHYTAPVMAMGVRQTAEVAVRAGFKHILFAVVPEETANAVDAYLKGLKADPNPFLVNGKLSEAAARGKALFDGKAKCIPCHTGQYYTDLKAYDVGTLGPYDRPDNRFYTPKLTEIYRTAPYLHDGRAATMEEVFTQWNKEDKHGVTSKLSKEELADLVAYLNSL
ncbi:MAG: c-type cytochrome [Planctomycetes bacterium]|nr:c-type cytochrome [Planctomycetota bacterium]